MLGPGAVKGSYVLLIHLPETQRITVGGLGEIDFNSGHYAYVGSARREIALRLKRCLHRERKPHWHIDYLLKQSRIYDVFMVDSGDSLECRIADGLRRQLSCVAGFGASDCRCQGHLFYAPEKILLCDAVRAVIESVMKKSSLSCPGVRCGKYCSSGMVRLSGM